MFNIDANKFFGSAIGFVLTLALGFFVLAVTLTVVNQFVEYRANVARVERLGPTVKGRIHIYEPSVYTSQRCAILQTPNGVRSADISPENNFDASCHHVLNNVNNWQKFAEKKPRSFKDIGSGLAVTLVFFITIAFVMTIPANILVLITGSETAFVFAKVIAMGLAVPVLLLGLAMTFASPPPSYWMLDGRYVATHSVYVTQDGSFYHAPEHFTEWPRPYVATKIGQFRN